MLYYVETGLGCAIIEAESLEQAHDQTLIEVGTYNGVQEVREASREDITWVGFMGGCLPPAARAKMQERR